MKQYLDLLNDIQTKGTVKPAAREGMPGTTSLFGYQFRHDLSTGFPLLTTKKMYWKGIVTELLWFLKGDTNIKYLLDNGCNIWNEDAYNYYLKVTKHISYVYIEKPGKLFKKTDSGLERFTFEEFIDKIKNPEPYQVGEGYFSEYNLGDCGFQYGRVWRDWGINRETYPSGEFTGVKSTIDQIGTVINSLRNTPESRRHIVTAIDPTHDTNLALYWCHAMFQFNCRPLTGIDKIEYWDKHFPAWENTPGGGEFIKTTPKYYLDCQLYQRSADAVLGVPFNVASYALLTHIIAKMCNMIPGELIMTYGDLHIYDNHKDAVKEQLTRTPTTLPHFEIPASDWVNFDIDEFVAVYEIDDLVNMLSGYNPQSSIKAKLSTGLK